MLWMLARRLHLINSEPRRTHRKALPLKQLNIRGMWRSRNRRNQNEKVHRVTYVGGNALCRSGRVRRQVDIKNGNRSYDPRRQNDDHQYKRNQAVWRKSAPTCE